MNDNPNQPAFATPSVFSNEDMTIEAGSFGLTKREYFAAMAMQGFCANESVARIGITPQEKALASVQIADALLEQLSKVK